VDIANTHKLFQDQKQGILDAMQAFQETIFLEIPTLLNATTGEVKHFSAYRVRPKIVEEDKRIKQEAEAKKLQADEEAKKKKEREYQATAAFETAVEAETLNEAMSERLSAIDKARKQHNTERNNLQVQEKDLRAQKCQIQEAIDKCRLAQQDCDEGVRKCGMERLALALECFELERGD
jgi:flagellar biosynthesis GTPase FlhF